MAKKKAARRPKAVLVKPEAFDDLKTGDKVRFSGSQHVFTVERHQLIRTGGNRYLIVHGPMGAGIEGGGQAKFIGPGSTSRVDPVTGKRKRLTPLKVYLVEKGRPSRG